MYNNDPDYTLIEKFQLLKKSLTGEADKVTHGLDYNATNYQRILTVLRDRLESPILAINKG